MDLPEFYDTYVDKVYKFFYIKCLDRHTAEDLTSQTFILFIEQQNVQKILDNKKYLYGIMRNIWLQFLRNKYTESLVEIESIEDFETYANNYIDEFESRTHPKHRVKTYVNKLPEKQRQVVEMRIFADMSTKETAKELRKDRNYVKTTYQRGLKNLRKMLKSPYLTIEGEKL